MQNQVSRAQVIVVSHFGLYNYGNRLQSYAVLKLLSDLGLKGVVAAQSRQPLVGMLKEKVKLVIPRRVRRKRQRFRNFHDFAIRYTPFVRVNDSRLSRELSMYPCIIVGSDQVWSPTYLAVKKAPEEFFLPGVSQNKKIALAPSFGVDTVPNEMEAMYAKGLASFSRLSVRESEGASLIRRLAGIEADVICDPTLAVEADVWREVSNTNLCPSEDYVLAYFLGEKSTETSKALSKFAEDRGLKVVEIMNVHEDAYKAGPSEFLALIDHARYMVTDSFHGMVFSLILQTPFCAVSRIDKRGRDMSSRLRTLAKMTGCEERLIGNSESLFPPDDIDWTLVSNGIARERKRFNEYLRSELARCEMLEVC